MKRLLGLALALTFALSLFASAASAGQTTATVMGRANYQEVQGSLYSWAGFPGPCLDPNAAIVLLEKTGPAEVVIGDSFSYQIQVSNRSANDVIGVTIEDVLPQGFRAESIEPRPSADAGGKLQWNLGTLAAKTAKRIVITGRAEQTGCIVTSSTAQVCFGMALPLAIRVVKCDISLKKTLPPVADLCDDIPMCLTVANTGSAVATNVRIIDDLPDGLQTADGKSQFAINVGNLAVGEQKTFNVNLRATRKGQFTNTARAVADRNCGSEDSASIRIVAPELELSARAPANGYICTTIPYEITVTNKGDSPAQEVMLVDSISGPFVVGGISDNGKVAQGRAVWNLGTLQPGESRAVGLQGSSDVESRIVSQFTVTARCAQPKSVTHNLDLVGVAGVLTSLQDSVDPVIIGGTTTYTITATNTGSRDDTNLRYTIRLDEGMEYVGGNGVTAITQTSNRTLAFGALPVLAKGATAAWQVTVRAVTPGDKRLTAELVTNQLTSPVSKSESTNFYQPDFTVVVAE